MDDPTCWNVTYSFDQKVGEKWVTYERNVVGVCNGIPVGYGPGGTSAVFLLDDLPGIVRVLREQLATTPTITLHPYPEIG